MPNEGTELENKVKEFYQTQQSFHDQMRQLMELIKKCDIDAATKKEFEEKYLASYKLLQNNPFGSQTGKGVKEDLKKIADVMKSKEYKEMIAAIAKVANGYNDLLAYLDNNKKGKKVLEKFNQLDIQVEDRLNKQMRTDKAKLHAMAIHPIQRLPRIEIMFKDMVKEIQKNKLAINFNETNIADIQRDITHINESVYVGAKQDYKIWDIDVLIDQLKQKLITRKNTNPNLEIAVNLAVDKLTALHGIIHQLSEGENVAMDMTKINHVLLRVQSIVKPFDMDNEVGKLRDDIRDARNQLLNKKPEKINDEVKEQWKNEVGNDIRLAMLRISRDQVNSNLLRFANEINRNIAGIVNELKGSNVIVKELVFRKMQALAEVTVHLDGNSSAEIYTKARRVLLEAIDVLRPLSADPGINQKIKDLEVLRKSIAESRDFNQAKRPSESVKSKWKAETKSALTERLKTVEMKARKEIYDGYVNRPANHLEATGVVLVSPRFVNRKEEVEFIINQHIKQSTTGIMPDNIIQLRRDLGAYEQHMKSIAIKKARLENLKNLESILKSEVGDLKTNDLLSVSSKGDLASDLLKYVQAKQKQLQMIVSHDLRKALSMEEGLIQQQDHFARQRVSLKNKFLQVGDAVKKIGIFSKSKKKKDEKKDVELQPLLRQPPRKDK